MATQRFFVPHWFPVSANKLVKKNWRVASRYLKKDAEIVATYARLERIVPATGKREVSLRFLYPKGKRMYDENNLTKSLYDAMHRAGMLVNDSPKWLKQGTVDSLRVDDALWGTEVVLVDL